MSTIVSQQNTFDTLKSKNTFIDSIQCFPVTLLDTIDNPSHSEVGVTESNIFKQMKYERNRLYSFQNKWPLREISPERLAGAGLFYLQHEDRVQCPFCHVILFNWTLGDNPLREHMRRSPKCPFLMGVDVGNVPISRERHQIPLKSNSSCALERNGLSHPTFSYKPKHPRMADVKRRLLTYSGWPVSWLSPQQLAECGLYYSGISDVATCFCCGGSLGNWEQNDDPWNEHRKFFPNCAFLAVTKNRSNSPKVLTCEEEQENLHMLNQGYRRMPSFDITSDVIREAQDIFPEDVVIESVRRKGGNMLSLQELCDDILELKQESQDEASLLIPDDKEHKANSSPNSKDLCVICMDKEKGIAYQPCGHFVSCPSCAVKINNCPVCRRPITHKIRIYNS